MEQTSQNSRKWAGWDILICLICLTSSIHISLDSSQNRRTLASVPFPNVPEAEETDEILQTYPAYLQLILAAAEKGPAEQLMKSFRALKKRSPSGAARFLKHLRFEMIEKLQLSGHSPKGLHSNSPFIQRWVSRYIRTWTRECDEELFRTLSLR